MNYKVRTQILNGDDEVIAEQEMPFTLLAMGFGDPTQAEMLYKEDEE